MKEKLKRRTPVLEAKEGLKSSGASSSDLGKMPARPWEEASPSTASQKDAEEDKCVAVMMKGMVIN